MDYLINENFVNNGENFKAKKEDIIRLLRLESEDNSLGKRILERIDFIKNGDTCNILGSKKLLDVYDKIDAEKLDLIISLSDIEYVGFYHDNEIILRFLSENWNARGIYDFSGDFLDSLFSIKKYAKFCLNNGNKDLLNSNLKEQMISRNEQVRQYRFLQFNDDLLLRGLTSTGYQNYDNNIAIYLTLNALHKYSEETKKNIYVQNGKLTDSTLNISFKQVKKIKIDSNTSMEIGVQLTNNELGKGSLKVVFTYTISNEKFNFSALGDNVINITHNASIENFDAQLEKIKLLSQYTEETISYITNIKNRNKIDRDQLSLIFSKLKRVRELSKQAKNKIDELYQKELIGNTLSLIEIFGKVESLETSIDDKAFIQITFNELIQNQLRN